MPAFLLSFVACMLVTMAGREQLRLARLASVLGVRAGLITAVGISAIVTVTLAAWSGSMLAIAISDASEEIVIAIALLLAALQLAVLRAKPAPKEPTWSFGAMLIVMLVAQICDGARLLVLAFTVHTGEPVLVGAGALDVPDILALADLISTGIPTAQRLPDVPDAAHLLPLECPGPVDAALREFLADTVR